ncbi:hypothetical protein [Kitasatospora cathayae]|uniref:Uncharacterized protein n=1 Tax=Kitasatospora cathayae TaxID=3004092 RepID=A0ABY7QH58_9ACTN|nr:hypothetical protein [Kitasatospora sp. HUAS 3-15]WBP92160.1 hypothetical protein O1G21_41170 [Kitasatospora sp. HUAS 3-15]
MPRPRLRLPERDRFSSVGDVVKRPELWAQLPEPVRDTVGGLMTHFIALSRTNQDGPACGGPLLIHEDGATECRAGCPGERAVLHVPEALQFCVYADRYDDALPEQACGWCAHFHNEAHDRLQVCPGVETDHDDGTQECSLGTDCHAPDGLHEHGQTCGLFEPCTRC